METHQSNNDACYRVSTNEPPPALAAAGSAGAGMPAVAATQTHTTPKQDQSKGSCSINDSVTWMCSHLRHKQLLHLIQSSSTLLPTANTQHNKSASHQHTVRTQQRSHFLVVHNLQIDEIKQELPEVLELLLFEPFNLTRPATTATVTETQPS